MKKFLLLLLLLLAGCDNNNTVPRNALQPYVVNPKTCRVARTGQVVGPKAFVLHLFGKFPERYIMLVGPGQVLETTGNGLLDTLFTAGYAKSELNADDGEGYVYPFVLFPSGKFSKFKLEGKILCADWYKVSDYLGHHYHFENDSSLVWADNRLPVNNNTLNRRFSYRGASLVVDETDEKTFVHGAHMTLPGGYEIEISGVESQ